MKTSEAVGKYKYEQPRVPDDIDELPQQLVRILIAKECALDLALLWMSDLGEDEHGMVPKK